MDGEDQPYNPYQLTASSKAKNGTLILLTSGQSNVRVGNILGTRTMDENEADPDVAKDTLVRKFTISPAVVYQGEMKRDFTIEFKAPGPMYNTAAADTDSNANIIVNIPTGIRPLGPNAVTVSTSGPGVGTRSITGGDTVTDPVTVVTVPFDKVNTGQTITVRYTADVALNATSFALANLDTSVGTDGATDATDFSGGIVSVIDGSGDVTLSPDFNAVSTPETFIVEYKALTALTDATLQIMPMGIVVDDPRHNYCY